MFGRWHDSFLSHFPAYTATLFVCLAVACKKHNGLLALDRNL